MKVSCETGNDAHTWNDMYELRELRPRMLKVAPKPNIVQQNYTKFEVGVPENTRKALEAKYGDKLVPSISSILQACAEPEMLIVSSSDIERIGQRLGKKPESSSELFGMIFQLGEEIKDLRFQKEQLEKQVGAGKATGSVQGVGVDLGAWTMKAMIKANENSVSLEDFLSKYLQDALENDWIS